MDTTYQQLQAQLFRALAHPARLAILAELRAAEACVCHLEAHLGYRQAYLSQQLAALRAAGLVRDRRDGWNVYYAIARPDVLALLDLSLQVVGGGGAAQPVPRNPACPCPKCSADRAPDDLPRFVPRPGDPPLVADS